MTIKIKNLTVKNFMSVGNQTQAVDFEKEQLTLVLGENLDQGGDDSGSRNGTGKTTIVNGLSYALYGNALTNIKKDNLINKINGKNMLVTLTFEKNGNQYRIERGRKPSIMKFYVNDVEQAVANADESQGDMRETQRDIDGLLGMSHDMFKHIVALNTYTEPFLSMRANDQREIIEQLLGITLLSEKAETLKEEIRKTKDSITQETSNIEATKRSNEKIGQSIDSLRTKQSAWNKQKERDLEKLADSIEELKRVDIEQELEQHAKLKAYDEQAARIKSLNKERATLDSAVIQAEKSVKKYAKEIEQLENNRCPACEQELHDHKHEEMRVKAAKSLEEATIYLNKVSNDLLKVVKELEQIGDINGRPRVFYETLEEALRHQNNLATLESTLVAKASEQDPYQEQIDELQNTALQVINWDAVNSLNAMKEHQEFLLKLLTNKDSFIRKKIIDQNLAYLNNRLTYYLDKMGLPHQVQFKNDLAVEITQLGQDLDFDNLSRGERNRLILSLSWAFRDVWESLYQSINLLFIDELLDNGLDANGVENGLGILKKMGRERNKNVYLISHKDELIGRVNNVLKVIKENGFTSYSNDIEVVE
jgi:DNA repair exonuclease SbcCD ATPase subunit